MGKKDKKVSASPPPPTTAGAAAGGAGAASSSTTTVADSLVKHIKKSDEAAVRNILQKNRSVVTSICHPTNQQPLLFWAVRAGADSVVKLLVEEFSLDPCTAVPAGADKFGPPLLEAVATGDDVIIRYFFEECFSSSKSINFRCRDRRNGANLFHVCFLSNSGAISDYFLSDCPCFCGKHRADMVEMLLEKNNNGDTPLFLAAGSAQLLEPVKAIASFFDEESSKAAGDDDFDEDENRQRIKQLRDGVTTALYPALHQLLTFNDVGADRVVRTTAYCIDKLGVSPIGILPSDDGSSSSGGSGKSKSKNEDGEQVEEESTSMSLLHHAVQKAEFGRASCDATPLLRAMLRVNIKKAPSKEDDPEKLRRESLRAVRWIGGHTDKRGESLLSMACDSAIGCDAMTVLLSCVSTDSWWSSNQQQQQQTEARSDAALQQDLDEAKKILLDGLQELLDNDVFQKEHQAQSFIAARLSTAKSFEAVGLFSKAGDIAEIEKRAKESLREWIDYYDERQELRQKALKEDKGAAAAAAAAEAEEDSDDEEKRGGGGGGDAVARARAAALKQSQAKKAAMEQRKVKAAAATAAAVAQDEDAEQARDDDDADDEGNALAAKSEPTKKKKKMITKGKRRPKIEDIGASVDDVEDDGGNEEQSVESSDDDAAETQAQENSSESKMSAEKPVIILFFVIALVIIIFFLGGDTKN